MKLSFAAQIARKYLLQLSPFCHKIDVAGSIRRMSPEVNDIEIVCIPQTVLSCQPDLFAPDPPVEYHPGFITAVNKLTAIKGHATGLYTQRVLPEGILLDLFMANPVNWGYILALRTGPAAYSKYLVTHAKRLGFAPRGGYLCVNNTILPTPTEHTLYSHLNLPYIAPHLRHPQV